MYVEKWVLLIFFAALAWLAGHEASKRTSLQQDVSRLRRRLREHGISED
jgi:hypothetical protein